jgi:ribosomal protein S18 acetylase RimI-like enzyme
MQIEDLPSVLGVQSSCYFEVEPESEASLRAKLLASPTTCFIAEHKGKVVGYLIAVPSRFESPPEFDAPYYDVPPYPNALYLHDLAVAPEGRGSGAGKMLVTEFISRFRASELPRACLIAIQDSASYWERYGFHIVMPSESPQAKIESYGNNAKYMELLQ